MQSIALAYAGVHQMFQLALAAHEMGELDFLNVSIFDGPGKFGALVGRFLHTPSLHPLDSEKLPLERVREYVGPLLVHRLGSRFLPRRRTDHLFTNNWFDSHAAALVRRSRAKIFVGAETCALRSMRAAKERGMLCVLDCPGIPAPFLNQAALDAAPLCGLSAPPGSNSAAMIERKRQELELADVILACSDFQKSVMISLGIHAERIRVIPLWVNATFWSAGTRATPSAAKPLRVVYAGALSLRKGVPFLLEAAKLLGSAVSLTLVGTAKPDVEALLRQYPGVRVLPYASKDRLREIYAEHDVLVMPTLGDSFGFVVLEAMAAGLPVIVSANCGAPLPDESWRVPAADAEAIAARLRHYVAEPGRLAHDGALAAQFAAPFTPERYRESARSVFRELLALRA